MSTGLDCFEYDVGCGFEWLNVVFDCLNIGLCIEILKIQD